MAFLLKYLNQNFVAYGIYTEGLGEMFHLRNKRLTDHSFGWKILQEM